MTGTRTTNFSLYKPLFDEEGWDDEVNGNFDTLDTQLKSTNDAVALKAPLNSPALTGTPTAPTATAGTDNQQIATTAFVQDAIDLVNQVKSGMILIWSGSIATIPAGYVICDGTNSTPDLRGKFVLGAGGTYAVGATGGAETHTLTVDEMPSHRHLGGFGSGSMQSGGGSEGASNTGYTGGGQAHNNMPPYYALAFIMKT